MSRISGRRLAGGFFALCRRITEDVGKTVYEK